MTDALINNALDLWSAAWDMAQAYGSAMQALGLWEAGGFVCSVAI